MLSQLLQEKAAQQQKSKTRHAPCVGVPLCANQTGIICIGNKFMGQLDKRTCVNDMKHSDGIRSS